MQKVFCDLCNKEITPNELAGGILRAKEIYPVLPIPGGRIENQMGSIIQKRIGQEVWELCENCQKLIWKIAVEKKVELAKTKQIISKS